MGAVPFYDGEILSWDLPNNQTIVYDFEGGCLTGLFGHLGDSIMTLGYYYDPNTQPASNDQVIIILAAVFGFLCCFIPCIGAFWLLCNDSVPSDD